MNEEPKMMLGRVRRMIVHGGLAHVDDIVACAMAYAFGVEPGVRVERRNPTAEELEDPLVLVLDVGGVHAPGKLDFDHHQRRRDEPPKCAYKLFGEWLGVDEEMTRLFPWYAVWNLVDVRGPFALAGDLGGSEAVLQGLIGHPLGSFVIRHFADDPNFRDHVARSIGKEIQRTRTGWLAIQDKVIRKTICGLPVDDFTGCLTEEITRCSDIWVRLNKPACLISKDSRGNGVTLLRCRDDARLDFSRCAGRADVAFCHPGGFIVKTKSKEDDVGAIIQAALTGEEGSR